MRRGAGGVGESITSSLSHAPSSRARIVLATARLQRRRAGAAKRVRGCGWGSSPGGPSPTRSSTVLRKFAANMVSHGEPAAHEGVKEVAMNLAGPKIDLEMRGQEIVESKAGDDPGQSSFAAAVDEAGAVLA